MEVDAGLKTGDLCLTAPDTVSCRKLIFSKAEDMIIVLAAFGLFIAVVEVRDIMIHSVNSMLIYQSIYIESHTVHTHYDQNIESLYPLIV